MDSGRLFFDPSACHGGNMLFLGNADNVFRGDFLSFFIFSSNVISVVCCLLLGIGIVMVFGFLPSVWLIGKVRKI